MYSFTLEPSGILVATTSGFWDVAEATSYIAELKARLTDLRRTRGVALTLVDRTDNQIQSAPVMDLFRDLDQILLATGHDRAAYIVQNSFAKMQGQRLSSSARLKVFLSPSAARIWLLAGHEFTAQSRRPGGPM